MADTTEETLSYLGMYERLLMWYFDNDLSKREIRLFCELKKHYNKLKVPEASNISSDEISGLCVGRITSLDLSFQYSFKSAYTLAEHLKGIDLTEDDTPVCAAVNEVHRFCFGNILKEVAYMFYILPEPICRTHYTLYLLQNYCDGLVQTLEMLDVEWKNVFKNVTFNEILRQFYQFTPQAILNAIIVQMKYTDLKELDDICSNRSKPLTHDHYSASCNGEQLSASKCIPLTNERIHHLIKLLEIVHTLG